MPCLSSNPSTITAVEHPESSDWVYVQIGWVPAPNGTITGVSFALWTNESVYSQHHKQMTRGYTHTIYRFKFNSP